MHPKIHKGLDKGLDKCKSDKMQRRVTKESSDCNLVLSVTNPKTSGATPCQTCHMGVMNSHTLERLWWEPPDLEIERQIRQSHVPILSMNIATL